MRIVKGGGLTLYQFVFMGIVFSVWKNTSWSNGDVNGWNFEFSKRGN